MVFALLALFSKKIYPCPMQWSYVGVIKIENLFDVKVMKPDGRRPQPSQASKAGRSTGL